MPLFKDLKRAIDHVFTGDLPTILEKVELSIVSDAKGYSYHASSSIDMLPFRSMVDETAIGSITVTNKTTWFDLDKMVIKGFKNFVGSKGELYDLGLKSGSILHYAMSCDILRQPKNRNTPQVPPIAFFKDGYLNRIRIYLKGVAQQGATDTMSFQTQIPKSAIDEHLDRLESTGRILFWNSKYIHNNLEMSFVVRRYAEYFAEYLVHKNGLPPVTSMSAHIASFDAKNPSNRFLSLQCYLEDIENQCLNNCRTKLDSKSGVPPPLVIVIENLQMVSDNIDEIISGFNKMRLGVDDAPHIIGTFVKPLTAAAVGMGVIRVIRK